MNYSIFQNHGELSLSGIQFRRGTINSNIINNQEGLLRVEQNSSFPSFQGLNINQNVMYPGYQVAPPILAHYAPGGQLIFSNPYPINEAYEVSESDDSQSKLSLSYNLIL